MRNLPNCLLTSVFAALLLAAAGTGLAKAQDEPLRLEILEGVIAALPMAVPAFVAETEDVKELAGNITSVVISDLVGSGLFREIPPEAHISSITSLDTPVQYPEWRAINAEILITGTVKRLPKNSQGDRRIQVRFRVHDIVSRTGLGKGMQYVAPPEDWRRVAHKIADQVYSRVTGEEGYFDSRIVFVSEFGDKTNRTKRLTIMDHDGANLQHLTSGRDIVIAPRFSPDSREIIFTSFASGRPTVMRMNLADRRPKVLWKISDMTFSPRFSPDGKRVLISRTRSGNTDVYEVDLKRRVVNRLTTHSAIDTAPTYSPDGVQIAFESDRGRMPQIYVMNLDELKPRRISFGRGSYSTPVWSPRGDYIAFTKQLEGNFHIGVMRTDGSDEKLLTKSFLDEAPTWSPNGRVLLFFREERGERGGPSLYSVDLTGRNLKRLDTPWFASDPNWSKLR